MDFDNMTDEQQHALNMEYRARMSIPDADDYVERALARSDLIRKSLKCHLDVRYGDGPKQTLDIFPASHPVGAVFVFIHGGYWFQLDKDIYSEVAQPMVNAGVTTVLPNYDLCPDVTIPDIVEQVQHALVWVHDNITSYGGDPGRIHISGHSAGGHLTGMMLVTDWASLYNRPRDLIKGSTPISGLFDIKPHRYTNLQPYIQLTAEDAMTHSPQFLPLHCNGPVICAVGGGETDSFRRQSREFAEKCQASGLETQYVEVADDHHFAITDRLSDRDDPLTKSIIAQMGL